MGVKDLNSWTYACTLSPAVSRVISPVQSAKVLKTLFSADGDNHSGGPGPCKTCFFPGGQTLDGFIKWCHDLEAELGGRGSWWVFFVRVSCPVSHSLLPGHVRQVASSTHFSCYNILLWLRNHGASLPQAKTAEAVNSGKSLLLLSCLFRHLSQSDQHSFLSWDSWSSHLGRGWSRKGSLGKDDTVDFWHWQGSPHLGFLEEVGCVTGWR